MREKTAAAVERELKAAIAVKLVWDGYSAILKMQVAALVTPLVNAALASAAASSAINAELAEHRRRLDMEESFFEEMGCGNG